MTRELSAIELLFKDQLDGMTARVHSGGFYSQGSMEMPCLLVYRQFRGLTLKSELKWNGSEFPVKIHEHLMKNRVEMDFKYSEIEKVIKVIDTFTEPFLIYLGDISPYGVKSFSTTMDMKGKLSTVKIEYENGSIVDLYGIEEPKK